MLGGASQVLDLGRTRRFHSRAQRLALGLEQGGCSAESCDRPAAWTEAHHEVPWSEGGGTSVRAGRLLCSRHHHLAHDSRHDMTRLATARCASTGGRESHRPAGPAGGCAGVAA